MTDPTTEPRPAESGQALIDRAHGLTDGVGVTRISDSDQMQSLLNEHLCGIRRETCSVLPAGPYPLETLRSSWDRDVGLLAGGVDELVIYQADAVRSPEMLHYVSEFANAGAKIRVARRATHRIIILDRQLVFVAMTPDTLKLPYLMVTEPALVRSFCAQFAATWRVAHSVGMGPEDALAVESVKEILQVLASGVTDEVAARQLGVSDRTVRRRVAAVLDLLGASSRFEAGVKAVQSGWL